MKCNICGDVISPKSNDVVYSTFSKSIHDACMNTLKTGHYCKKCTETIEKSIEQLKQEGNRIVMVAR